MKLTKLLPRTQYVCIKPPVLNCDPAALVLPTEQVDRNINSSLANKADVAERNWTTPMHLSYIFPLNFEYKYPSNPGNSSSHASFLLKGGVSPENFVRNLENRNNGLRSA